jgi:hypothetical protein
VGSTRPYARVYYVDLEADYPTVWNDNDCLSTWLRMLTVAEAAWPALPEIPRSARMPFVQRIAATSLIELVGPYKYRIKGMDAERSARSNAASNAARTRYGTADSTAVRTAPTMPNQTEPNQTKPSLVARENDGPKDKREERRKRLEGLSDDYKAGRITEAQYAILRGQA